MKPMPEEEQPTLKQLFGEEDLRCDVMQLAVHRIDTLADIDRVLLCKELPRTVRTTAERHQRVLADIQASAGNGERLRELLVQETVVLRSGAIKLTRRLIQQCA